MTLLVYLNITESFGCRGLEHIEDTKKRGKEKGALATLKMFS